MLNLPAQISTRSSSFLAPAFSAISLCPVRTIACIPHWERHIRFDPKFGRQRPSQDALDRFKRLDNGKNAESARSNFDTIVEFSGACFLRHFVMPRAYNSANSALGTHIRFDPKFGRKRPSQDALDRFKRLDRSKVDPIKYGRIRNKILVMGDLPMSRMKYRIPRLELATAYVLQKKRQRRSTSVSEKQKKRLVKWLRPDEFLTDPKVIDRHVDSGTIKQTIVSDCSFVASLAIAERHKRRFGKRLVTNIIYPQNKHGDPIHNPCGKYMVKLHLNGIWRKDDFADNREYITVMVYKTEGCKKVYLPYDPKPIIEGTRINSPHYLCQMIVKEPGIQRYSLVVAQYEKMNTIYYTLRVYSSAEFKCGPIRVPYKFHKKETGEWKGKTAGGCGNGTSRESYLNNPVFHLTLDDGSDDNSLLVDLRAPKEYNVGFEIQQVSSFRERPFERRDSGVYRPGYTVMQLDGVPGGVYAVRPMTFMASQEGPFILRVDSSCTA